MRFRCKSASIVHLLYIFDTISTGRRHRCHIQSICWDAQHIVSDISVKDAHRVSFRYIMVKNQPKSALLCHKTYDIWCNIATWFLGSFDVKHVSLDMCYTFSTQFRYENNTDTTYKLLVVFQKYVDTLSAIYQTCQNKNYILRHSFRYIMQLKPLSYTTKHMLLTQYCTVGVVPVFT